MSDSPAVQEVAQSAQRRQLTVMFCDMVDSTPMASRLDPEDTADVYRAFRDLCASTIEAAGGYVAKYMGDGIMAYFGYPRAHEDDAERAVYAAVAIAEAVPRLTTGGDAPMGGRIGIATGLVVVGDLVGDASVEARDVVGETPNLAARLQSAAKPNEILVSSPTQRLAAGLFAFENAGRPRLKGIKLKEPVWRVTGAKVAPERFRARQPKAPGPMLGREAELETLMQRWRACLAGGVQVVGVVGEAGIGKSRLVEAFHRRIAVTEPHIWLEGGGAQIFSNTPFHPVAQAIYRRLADGKPLAPGELVERLKHSLNQVGVEGEAAALHIAELLDARPPDAGAPAAMAGEPARRGLIDALAEWLLKSALRWPTVLVLEDRQWADPSTLEFLQTLIARAAGARLLVLYTSRPDDAPSPWSAPETRIVLGRLDRESIRNLVIASAPQALAPDLLERLVARADGVPLFAEELAGLVGAEGADATDDFPIPSALSDLLMARLDQLGPARQLAQVAAVLGGEIPRPLLAAVAGVGERELDAGLDALVAANVLVASEAGGERTYAFRHALTEAAAYESLLKRLRRTLHKRAALVMLERFPDLAERHPEVLAQHWLKAGDQQRAVDAWKRAARLAFGRHALHEALHACEQGIAVIHALKASPELERDEIALLHLLAEAARGVGGYASPRAIAAVERARALADRHGGIEGELQRCFGEWAARSSLGDYEGAAEPAERFVQLARAEDSPPMLASAHMIMLTRYRLGDLRSAEDAYQSGLPYFEHPDFMRRPGALAQTFGNAAVVAWLLGRSDEAAARSERSLELSRSTGNPYDMAFADYMAAHLTLLSGEASEAERVSRQAIRLSEENGYAAFASATRIMLGRALAALGRADEGVATMLGALGGRGGRPINRSSITMYMTWLAEAHAMAGDADRARAVIEEALAMNPRELFFRPETLRIRGDLARTEGRLEAAETDYETAVTLARSMGANTLMQRAQSSLAGLRRAQGLGARDEGDGG
jgi:class 3 adenylate cyclase/tetratricopeptide (TPR) repeat protein